MTFVTRLQSIPPARFRAPRARLCASPKMADAPSSGAPNLAKASTTGIKNLSHLTFSSQNCNSLNISTNCPKQSKKIAAILALQTSIIFLSDIRLNTGVNGSTNFFSPRYDMLHNSTTNSCGVAILIDKSLQYVIQNEHRDANNNIMAVELVIYDTNILLISIYGPNNNNYVFYDSLKQVLAQHRGTPVICAGDWNTTYSTEPGTNNIDILNMLNPPSITRSAWISDICEEYSLSDPFRALHYDKKDFTYIPRDGGRNRSRLDFFLISDILLGICNSCNISPSLNIALFDHKSVMLSFLSKKNFPIILLILLFSIILDSTQLWQPLLQKPTCCMHEQIKQT
jgi:exonuclease III